MTRERNHQVFGIHRCTECNQLHLGRCGPKIAVMEETLSYRQNQIVWMVCEGYSNAIMADQLGVSTETIKRHLTEIFNRCGKSSRLQLAAHFSNRSLQAKIVELQARIVVLESRLVQEEQVNARLNRHLSREAGINNALIKGSKHNKGPRHWQKAPVLQKEHDNKRGLTT